MNYMWHPTQGEVEILLVASYYRNWDKLWPDGPLGSYADFTFYLSCSCQDCQSFEVGGFIIGVGG